MSLKKYEGHNGATLEDQFGEKCHKGLKEERPRRVIQIRVHSSSSLRGITGQWTAPKIVICWISNSHPRSNIIFQFKKTIFLIDVGFFSPRKKKYVRLLMFILNH